MKKLFFWIIIVIAIVVGIFFLFFSKKSSPQVTNALPSNGSLPQVGTQANSGSGALASSTTVTTFNTTASATGTLEFGVVSNEPVANYFVDTQGNVTVVEPDGKIASIVNGQVTYLSSSEVQDLISASFSANGQKIALSFGDVSDPQTSVFDVTAKTWTPLPVGLFSPSFSPSGSELVYMRSNTNGTESLMMLNASSTTAKPITLITLHVQDVSAEWTNQNEIALTDKSSVYSQASALLYNVAQKTVTPIILNTLGLETDWSNATDSLMLEFSSNGTSGGSLQLIDPATGSTQPIKFLTLPTKCTFANVSTTPDLFCAVPQNQNELSSAQLPDAYNQMAIFTSDNFYAINTATGALATVFSPTTGNYDATNLRVFNNNLFFVNRYDNKLYAISLSPAAVE